MLAEGLSVPLLSALGRPDLRVLADGRRISLDLADDAPFRLADVSPSTGVVLGRGAGGSRRALAFHLRHALERAVLADAPREGPPPAAGPVLGALAAARTASLFWRLDAAGDEPDPADFIGVMAAERPPADADLASVAASLGAPAPTEAECATLRAAWPSIGPVETLLATGGDSRLLTDPDTRLNHYGTSHRPRPWAVTYASSTASSLSERGFAAAERARRRLLRATLAGAGDAAGRRELDAVRAAIVEHYGLPPGTGVVLAASGTDCEIVALAAIAAARPGARLLNLLTAPDETGSGVPLASVGRHFADDTARGAAVSRGTLLRGMPEDVARADLAVRHENGTLIEADAVDRAAADLVRKAVDDGRHVLLHYLDCSKTGLIAPSIECVARLGRGFRGRLDVVVDACQARLNAERVRSYVQVGWTVMVTGSKFFTGPPFCGAILLPPSLMAALADVSLPAGLSDYCGRADWPVGFGPAGFLPEGINTGMVLRWQAAIAEMQAFAAVPGLRKRSVLDRFTEAVRAAIDRCPDTMRVSAPPLRRPVLGDAKLCWDDLQTIIPFLVLGPDGRPLDLAASRRLYGWLNADVRDALPPLGATEGFLASLRCHVGQPAPVADGAGGIAGALRISAGARLVSGEPSHEGIEPEARLLREIADATACLEKLSLLMRHHARLASRDPKPSFGAPPDA